MEQETNICYANAIELSRSPYEVRIEFAIETPSESKMMKKTVADIRISPELAKTFSEMMNQLVHEAIPQAEGDQ